MTLFAYPRRLAAVLLLVLVAGHAHAATGDKLNVAALGAPSFQSDFTKPLEPTFRHCYYFGDPACTLWNGRALPGERELYVDSAYCGVNPFATVGTALVITARPATADETARCKGLTSSRTFVSGLLTTQRSFSQVYGYFEVALTLPQGQGAWPAFWLIPTVKTKANQGRVPELDVMEAWIGSFAMTDTKGRLVTIDKSFIPQATVHTLDAAGKDVAATDWGKVKPLSTPKAAHTYGLMWTPTEVIAYVDRVEVWRAPLANSEPHYMILNLAIDARYPNPAASQMVVQWIKAWPLPR
jgi:beta-glucanase (GH16 family)